jgi:outer membrane protein assembly factor BamD
MATSLTSVSCKKKGLNLESVPPEALSSDESLFKLGETYIKKDMDKGMLYLRQLIDSYPRSFYAQRAKLLIADTYFNKGDEANMILARAEYREFMSLYPTSPSVPHCQYQIAMTYYKNILKPSRDQTKTIQALNEFKKVIARFPNSEYAAQAEDKIRECEQRLAAHEFHIGEHYYKTKSYRAALTRLQGIITTYPDFDQMDAIYFYLAEIYYRTKQYDQSFPYYTKVISDFPNSKFVKKAQNRLRLIEQTKKTENVKKTG